MSKLNLPFEGLGMYIYIYKYGPRSIFGSKSSIFEECIILFQVLVYKQMLSFFEECITVSFSKPQLNFQKRCLEYYSPLTYFLLWLTHIYIYIY